eukprot:5065748-Amphidinium_carterae.1
MSQQTPEVRAARENPGRADPAVDGSCDGSILEERMVQECTWIFGKLHLQSPDNASSAASDWE